MPKIYYVRPGQQPETREIEESPETLSQLLDGGYMEQVRFRGEVVALVDDDAARKALPVSCTINGHVVQGPAIFARHDDHGDLVDLTDDDLAIITEHVEVAASGRS